jgi:hypothetical protein
MSNIQKFHGITGSAFSATTAARAVAPERGPSTTGLSGSVQTGTPNRIDMSTAQMFYVSQSSSDAPSSSPLNMNRAPAFLKTDSSNASALKDAGFTNLGKLPKNFKQTVNSYLLLPESVRHFNQLSPENQAKVLKDCDIGSFYVGKDGNLIPNFNDNNYWDDGNPGLDFSLAIGDYAPAVRGELLNRAHPNRGIAEMPAAGNVGATNADVLVGQYFENHGPLPEGYMDNMSPSLISLLEQFAELPVAEQKAILINCGIDSFYVTKEGKIVPDLRDMDLDKEGTEFAFLTLYNLNNDITLAQMKEYGFVQEIGG